MRPVAIVSYAQLPPLPRNTSCDVAEMVRLVTTAAIDQCGIERAQIGFTCSGSCDYLEGLPFAFVGALDGVGAWPPISESHVEMDGAWALYEAWVRLQHGDVDAALVYAFGNPSSGDLDAVMALQLDPYFVAPLWPDRAALAALQARALLDAGTYTERDFASVTARCRAADENELLAAPCHRPPLRPHDASTILDGAAAVVLAAGDLASDLAERPAWVRGMDHRIEPHGLGCRDLIRSPSTLHAAEKAGVDPSAVDIAELHAPFSHQELILRDAFRLGPGTRINPSGGALVADPMMATGLVRIGEAASAVLSGDADIALGHATRGHCLQHNLVCHLGAAP